MGTEGVTATNNCSGWSPANVVFCEDATSVFYLEEGRWLSDVG